MLKPFIKTCLFSLPLTLITLSYSYAANAGEIYESFPETIDANQKYVFYSHGYIVEGTNTKPKHPEWGIYDFPEIKKVLADDNYHLIAYHRAKHTEPFQFAKKLAKDVAKLIAADVKPSNITLLGFSRGGALSILTTNELKLSEINTIILAGCAGLIKKHTQVKVYGHVKSIYETSDQVGSCQFLIDRSDDVASFNEISISTGKSHGAFYNPLPVWVEPVKQWITDNTQN